MKKMRKMVLVIFFVPLLSTTVQAQTDLDFMKLWNACQPIFLVVEDTTKGSKNIGLTEQRIQTMAESRLRAARIYHKDSGTALYINVHYLEGNAGAFSLRLEFQQPVRLLRYGKTMIATTWDISVLGTAAGSAEYIMQVLSEYVDRFVNEYLRVNADSCS